MPLHRRILPCSWVTPPPLVSFILPPSMPQCPTTRPPLSTWNPLLPKGRCSRSQCRCPPRLCSSLTSTPTSPWMRYAFLFHSFSCFYFHYYAFTFTFTLHFQTQTFTFTSLQFQVCGYLAGQWDPNSHNLAITHTFPCLTPSNDTSTETAQRVETEIYEELYGKQLTLVGWYHSNPTGPPAPRYLILSNVVGTAKTIFLRRVHTPTMNSF